VKLLGLTNFYPPLGYGYGAICADVMGELAARGHGVTVLCAEGGEGETRLDVRQELGHVPGAWRRPVAGLRAERTTRRALGHALERGVDAALAWHMRGIPKTALTALHEAKLPVIYMLGDLWVVYERPGPPALWPLWQRLDRLAPYRALRGLALRPPPIAEQGLCVFASQWLRDAYARAGFRPRHAQVIPNGVSLELFGASGAARSTGGERLLFAGRTDASKGADIAVEALALLPNATLTLAGDAPPATLAWLDAIAQRAGVAERVTHLGALARPALAAAMAHADVLVMPGRVEEGFGLVYLEAMAAGLPVVGTVTGGARDFCRDGQNSYVVNASSADLARGVRAVINDRSLRARLLGEGRRTARAHSLQGMVDRVTDLLDTRP
jgi:glycosyltransferase involved in cell wall biosynthesis